MGRLRADIHHRRMLLGEGIHHACSLISARRDLVRRAGIAGLSGLDLEATLSVLEQDGDIAWLEFLAVAYRRAGRRADAIRLLERVLTLEPERVSAWRTLAACGIDRQPERMFPAAFLYHHLGLGDHIICKALVDHFAGIHGSLGLFAPRRYLDSVRFMYRDDPRIRLFPARDDREVASFLRHWPRVNCVRIGFEHLDIRSVSFAESFYRQIGMDYAKRWEGTIRRDPAREEAFFRRVVTGDGPYIFLHEDQARGFAVDRGFMPPDLAVIRSQPGLTANIFDYGLVLERAAEIHSIDSSFRHVVDSYDLKGPRLFLHLYAKGVQVPGRLPWKILT